MAVSFMILILCEYMLAVAIFAVFLFAGTKDRVSYCDDCGKDIMKDDEYYCDGVEVLCLSCYRGRTSHAANRCKWDMTYPDINKRSPAPPSFTG